MIEFFLLNTNGTLRFITPLPKTKSAPSRQALWKALFAQVLAVLHVVGGIVLIIMDFK